MPRNKVQFGFNNVHFGEYNVSDEGVVTLGQPFKQRGAVSFTPENSAEQNDFYADDVVYWTDFAGEKITGDVTVAKFEDEFKERFLGYRRLTSGGLAEIRNAKTKKIYMCFEVKGDEEKRRFIYYNGTLGKIKNDFNTVTNTKDPATESINVTFNGDDASEVLRAVFKPGDEGYETLFTNPQPPAIEEESE